MASRACLFLLSITAILSAAPGDTVVPYPAVPGFGPSVEYTLTVNGKDVPVFKHLSVAIAQFAFAGRADLVITMKRAIPSKYQLSPQRIAWNEKVSGSAISFSITTPRYIVLHYGATVLTTPHYQGMDNAEGVTEKLFIFAMPLESESPKPGDPGVVALQGTNIQSAIDALPAGGTLYIGPGSYSNGAITMRADRRVYVSQGAKLAQGFTFGTIENSRVFGRGTIDLAGAESGTGIRMNGSQNCQADDLLHLRRGYGYHAYWTQTTGNSFRNMKLVTDEEGRTGCNTDGYDPNNGPKDDTVSNTFVYITDDPTAPGFQESMEGYVFKNSVLWNHGCGRALKVGAQNGGNVYSRFCWENIDVIACEWPIAMTWQGSSGTPTVFHHFYVKNLHVEGLTRSWLNVAGSDAYDLHFQKLVFPYWGSRTQGFFSDKITGATVQHLVVGGKVMQSMTEAKLSWNQSTQKITFRTDEPTEVTIRAASLYASRAPVTPATFVVSRRAGSSARALTLKYRIWGSARNGIDYEKIPGEITIPAGASSADITIRPLAGTGGIKNVLLEVEHISDTTYLLGADFQAQIAVVSSGSLGADRMTPRSAVSSFSVPRRVLLGNGAAGTTEGVRAFSLGGRSLGSLDEVTKGGGRGRIRGIVICRSVRD